MAATLSKKRVSFDRKLTDHTCVAIKNNYDQSTAITTNYEQAMANSFMRFKQRQQISKGFVKHSYYIMEAVMAVVGRRFIVRVEQRKKGHPRTDFIEKNLTQK